MNIAVGREQPQLDRENEEREPWRLTIPDRKDVIVGELAQPGEWVVANIQTNSAWPVKAQKVMYRRRTFWIIPLMRGFYPAVAMRVPTGERVECEKLLMRFVSILAWVEEAGFLVEYLSGGSLPAPIGRDKERGFAICEEFDLSYLPKVSDEEAMLALALMREGRGLNHMGYAFLSFYRILETAFPNDARRMAWISASIDGLTGFGVKEAVDGIRAQGVTTPNDIGIHLFRSGRCAMAHGARKPIVDPDNPSDLRRLGSELPIVRQLAVKAIEEVFGVETRGTVFGKHLYELDGFKKILGQDTVGYLMRGEQITDERAISVPDIGVQIRKRDPYAPLANLTVTDIAQNGKLLRMCFESKGGDVRVRFQLDFGNERLEFSIFHDLGVKDTGTAESAETVAEVRRFQNEYFGNGQLHIVDAGTGDLIARKDAYIPLNMYMDFDAADAEIAHWRQLAEQRRHWKEQCSGQVPRSPDPYGIQVTMKL